MASGWIKIHRKITDNPLYFAEPFTRIQAWIDLLLLANHKEGFFYVRGNQVTVGRGQVGMSQENLAQRWRWSRGKVNRYLKDLENMGQITQQKNRITTVISICNYEKYQDDNTTDNATDNTTDGQQTAQQTGINKNVKKDKNDKKGRNNHSGFDFSFCDPEYRQVFDDWLEYKKERRESFKTQKSLEACYKKLIRLSGGNPQTAVLVVEQSMENNWAGLFDLKQGLSAPRLGCDERIENGRRTYGTGFVTVPADAPPRPSARYFWNAETKQWIMQ